MRISRATAPIALSLALATAVVAGCSGDGTAEGGVDRQAGAVTRGTEVCVRNGSSANLRIETFQSGPAHAATSGAVALDPGATRCIDSDSYTARGAASARVTIASGEVFSVQGFNPPFDPPWIGVNGDGRELEVDGSTDFKIGVHPIDATRLADSPDRVRFDLVIR